MTDSFLAEIESFSSATKKGKIKPLVIMADGTKNQTLDAKAVGGITPQKGDIVLVLAIRNNLDDKEISIYYEASWSNCRIIGIAATNTGTYKFTGNYQFTGGITFTGDLTVTKDLNVTENLIVGKDATISENLTVTQDASIGGGLSVGSTINAVGKISTLNDIEVAGVSFNTFYEQVKAHTHIAPGGLAPAPTGTPQPPIT